MNNKRIAAGALAFVLVFGIGAPVLEQAGVLTNNISVSAADEDIKVGWKPTRYYQDAEGNYSFQYVQSGYMQIISLDNDDLTEFEIPSEITDEKTGLSFPVQVVYKEAFQCKNHLEKVTIPSTVNRIGVNAFANCTGLEEVVGMEGVTVISEDAFASCESLKSITLPEVLQNIGTEAFSHCNSLEELTIPGTVTLMGSYIASGCTSLKILPLVKVLQILLLILHILTAIWKVFLFRQPANLLVWVHSLTLVCCPWRFRIMSQELITKYSTTARD